MRSARQKILAIGLGIILGGLGWAFFLHGYIQGLYHFENPPLETVSTTTQSVVLPPNTEQIHHRKLSEAIPLQAIQPRLSYGLARVIASSSPVFAYAHGTLAADGRLFIGMASHDGNIFPTNEIVIFDHLNNLARPVFVTIPVAGEIDSMVYDPLHDRIYFPLSHNGALRIYDLNPRTYVLKLIASSTAVDLGRRPAIVTDGHDIYGITNTASSSIFRLNLSSGDLTVNSVGHIAYGHSAAIGEYGSTTELYFGGGMSDGFEKADASTLQAIATTTVGPCSITDDMPFEKTGAHDGLVFLGCEMVPYGIRMHTADLSFERFALPGASLGMFLIGSDLYNTATDGYLDIFPGARLDHLERYLVTASSSQVYDLHGQALELNELLFEPRTHRLFLTAWWGVPGLFEVALPADAKSL